MKVFRFPTRSGCSYGDTELWVNFTCLNAAPCQTKYFSEILEIPLLLKSNNLHNMLLYLVAFKRNFRLWNIKWIFLLRLFFELFNITKRSASSNLELYPLSGSSCWCWGRSGGDVQFCHCGRGRGGDAACRTQGGWDATTHTSHSCRLAPALLLLAGHVDAHLDGFSLLQSKVQLLWWLIFLLFNLLLNLKTKCWESKEALQFHSPIAL